MWFVRARKTALVLKNLIGMSFPVIYEIIKRNSVRISERYMIDVDRLVTVLREEFHLSEERIQEVLELLMKKEKK
ncbi:MAG: hypothetical protein QW051_00600 [Candidatus Aenigmatarchaeota archaeon]